jgi:hypothetical protein
VPSASYRLLVRSSASLAPGFLRALPGGTYEFAEPALRNATTPPVSRNPDGSLRFSADFLRLIAPFLGQNPSLITTDNFDSYARWRFEIYSAELQQIWQKDRQTLLIGARGQTGRFNANTLLSSLTAANAPLYQSPAAMQQVSVDFNRTSVYVYNFFRAAPGLTLIAGASRDQLHRPDNIRQSPVNNRRVGNERSNAKVGFTFAPTSWMTVRGAYTEALGGVTYDESVRLEPVQLAGFNQAFRSVISESLVGSVEAPVYHGIGLSLEGNLATRTWWGASWNRIREDVDRTIGSFDFIVSSAFPWAILPAGTRQILAYREDVFAADIHQLLGDAFEVGAGYRRTVSDLHQLTPQIPVTLLAEADRLDRATMHELTINAAWNSPTGWFAGAKASWWAQQATATPANIRTSEDFWQIDTQVGHRFHHNQREISAGVLNLTDTDYRLSPLTYTRNLPRERTLFVRCRLGF